MDPFIPTVVGLYHLDPEMGFEMGFRLWIGRIVVNTEHLGEWWQRDWWSRQWLGKPDLFQHSWRILEWCSGCTWCFYRSFFLKIIFILKSKFLQNNKVIRRSASPHHTYLLPGTHKSLHQSECNPSKKLRVGACGSNHWPCKMIPYHKYLEPKNTSFGFKLPF